jgi:hypothetical protein
MTFDFAGMAGKLSQHGLAVRGGFAFEFGEAAPVGPSGNPARSVILIGNTGPAMWPQFSAWRSAQAEVPADPLDTWSKQVIDPIAVRIGARAIYPNDKPFAPFQQWAMRAEGLHPSPLGILIHPEYGLWHAYRGALLLDDDVGFPPFETLSHPCEQCVEKPCLTACPVSAFTDDGFGAQICAQHVQSADGAPCRKAGCLARNACPVGREHRYSGLQQEFHLAAFLRARAPGQ